MQNKKPSLKLPQLRPDQYAILSHPAKLKYVACGRRWGKTTAGGIACLLAANAGGRVAWVSPDYKRSRPLWNFIRTHTGNLIAAGVVSASKSDQVLEWSNKGGYIGIYSGENADALRGEAFNLVIPDEAAFLRPDVIEEIILPTLADFNGDMLCLSTPSGINWFYAAWLAARHDKTGYTAAWQAPSSDNPNPNIRAAFDRARLTVPELKFKQEWLAEFVASGAGVFQNVTECATATPQTQAIPDHEYSMGIDWGRVFDNTVITLFDQTLNEVCFWDAFTGMNFDSQLNRIEHVYKLFKPRSITAEKNSFGAPLIETMRAERDLPVQAWTMTLASKNELIDALALKFQFQNIAILDNEIARAEFAAFAGEPTASGLYKYAAPPGFHDDFVISTALAVYGAKEVASITTMPNPFWDYPEYADF